MDDIRKEVKETKYLLKKIEEKIKGVATNNYVEEEIKIDIKYIRKIEGIRIIFDPHNPNKIS